MVFVPVWDVADCIVSVLTLWYDDIRQYYNGRCSKIRYFIDKIIFKHQKQTADTYLIFSLNNLIYKNDINS